VFTYAVSNAGRTKIFILGDHLNGRQQWSVCPIGPLVVQVGMTLQCAAPVRGIGQGSAPYRAHPVMRAAISISVDDGPPAHEGCMVPPRPFAVHGQATVSRRGRLLDHSFDLHAVSGPLAHHAPDLHEILPVE
jgi:hypothetical protein